MNRTTIPVTDAIRLIQLHEGEIWQVSREPGSTTVRASIGQPKKYFRIIVPISVWNWNGQVEKGRVPWHIVRDLTELRQWLSDLAGKERGQ